MLATWTDPISKKTYNNLNTTNYVLNKLAASSQTYIGIDLLQSGTYVAFWTSDSTKLPITIVIEKDTFILNTFSAKAPTILDSTNYLKVNLNPSALNFQAYNSQKQYFDFDTVATVKDRIKLKEINKPEFDVISFYYSGTNSYVYPITLVLDFTDTVGVIKGPRTTAFSCGQADTTNVVTIVRPIGSHTYVAISKGGCSWKGELVSNDSSSCYIVPLSANLNCQ